MDTQVHDVWALVAVLILIIRELIGIVLYLLKRKTNGKQSGSLDPSYWKEEFRMAVKSELEAERSIRNENVRRIVREEIQQTRRT